MKKLFDPSTRTPMQQNGSSASLVRPQRITAVPPLLYLTPTRTMRRAMERALRESGLELQSRALLADAIEWSSTDNCAVVGPMLGAPAAAAAVEPLLLAGARSMILFGTAGGICAENRRLQLGDLAAPVRAFAGDGTSQAYGGERMIALGRRRLQQQTVELLAAGLPADGASLYAEACVWTTDAPYRETKVAVARARSAGACAVEMEYAALLQLANAYEAELAAVFVISDLLADEWLPGFSKKVVKQRVAETARLLAAAAGPAGS